MPALLRQPLLNVTVLLLTSLLPKVGHINRVIMGLDKYNKTPCGFCFVFYYVRWGGAVFGAPEATQPTAT